MTKITKHRERPKNAHRTVVELDANQFRKLKILAAIRGETVTAIIRKQVSDLIDNAEATINEPLGDPSLNES